MPFGCSLNDAKGDLHLHVYQYYNTNLCIVSDDSIHPIPASDKLNSPPTVHVFIVKTGSEN